ncbi:MAG: class I SAM-dependent methyltransferase [Candidatus Thermoplasmatota archaeon]|nr:class I SAM-dependent methyltransferase [Candidatus Thermoplasmatota archaeon]
MKETVIEMCPLCNNSSEPFHNEEFFLCNTCYGIFRPKRFYLSPSKEKLRYEQHNNDVNDKRYQQFVSPITTAVLKEWSSTDIGLDFGAGTGPVISKILNEYHYAIYQYDPFFHDHPSLLKNKYDYIVCCETIEHFHHPKKEFGLLKKILRPKGILYCMTHIYNYDIPFADWYYRKDPTHVFIYQKETCEWISDQFDFHQMTIYGRLIRFVNR